MTNYEGTAIVLADDMVGGESCKTTHALIRKSNRYKILGVIDPLNAGNDAGVLLDGVHRGIPVYTSIESMLEESSVQPDFCIVGIATVGGRITGPIRDLLRAALSKGISVVSGLHEHVSQDELLSKIANEQNVNIIDIRKSRPLKDLAFWTGKINSVKAPRIALMGTDCNLGKRTTAQFMVDECNKHNIKAEMVYTGQTGWLQGGKHGFILDSTVNDFVSGELEKAIVECDRVENPDVIFIEGQSGLRNPSGPCGSELLVSGQAKGVILQCAPGLDKFQLEGEYPMPPIAEELQLIKLYGSSTIAVTLNNRGLDPAQIESTRKGLQDELGVPVVDVLGQGVADLIPLVKEYLDGQN